MALVSMTGMLRVARAGGYAVGAFNVVDYNSLLAVVRAAEDLDAPVVVQTSVKTVRHWGHAAMVGWARQVAGDSALPVVLHLDHCGDVGFCKACIEAGWTSVMIDGSARPFDENLAMTREVLEAAGPAGVSVEAELGRIVGVEEEAVVEDRQAGLADPEAAVRFCEGLGLAAFAPAVGTAHGLYKGEPEIEFGLLEEIARRTGVAIALHGGTGLSDEVFRHCISLGCAKVNISTQLKHAFIDGFCEYHVERRDYDPLKVVEAQFERVRSEMARKIALFGGAGRASEAGG
jgi:ketose-bisphosphate aldolase